MPDILSEYTRKRHFDTTAEPIGSITEKPPGPLRFVVQHHISSHDHYDLRLEWNGALKSWAVPKGPSYDRHDKRLAVRVEDHPLEYRTFEGIIPKGQYGGGTVMVWDEGVWRPEGDPAAGLAAGSLKFTLEGSRLRGRWALVRLKAKPGEADKNWLLIKEKDEYETVFDPARFATSIKTGRTMGEIGADAVKKDQNSLQAMPKNQKKLSSGGERQELSGPAAGTVPVTHPEKILYRESGITKGDVADYYTCVAQRMMPYVQGRILSVVRCPGGVEHSCFYKKHPSGAGPGTAAIRVPASGGGAEEYFYITNTSGLLAEVQMNTLEFHTWGSRAQTLEHPDIMVFDLDPDEGMALERIRLGVKDLKGLLDQLSLASFLKTTGGKGYHIVIPFLPAAGWDSFHDFAQTIAKTMEAMWPDRYTANVRKAQRKGRIFIDWIRNGRGATSVAPYSVRAREGAPVSMPIAWRELDAVAPDGITMPEAIARLRGADPWEGFFSTGQRLK